MQDSTRFVTSHGSDGFVDGNVRTRMKGASFVWKRSGMSPAAGWRFEIRPKSWASVLDPSTPTGVDEIHARANRSAAQPRDTDECAWRRPPTSRLMQRAYVAPTARASQVSVA